MDNSLRKRDISRKRRVLRVRKKLKGTAIKPRLCVSKSNKHILAQLIDDQNCVTIAATGTLSKGNKLKKSVESSKQIGQKIAELAKEKNISTVVFDRGRLKYHGLIASLADGARENGLEF
jgi:large subunit ribosomal protein L18